MLALILNYNELTTFLIFIERFMHNIRPIHYLNYLELVAYNDLHKKFIYLVIS